MLSDEQILRSRAYSLDHPPEAFPAYKPGKGRTLNFRAWYEPQFPMEGEYLRQNCMKVHAPPITGRVLEMIEALSCDIRNKGLRNPVLVTGKMGVWNLHPGKCRVAALKMLEIDVIPAVVLDFDRHKLPDTAKYEITSPEQFAAHFCGDIAPEFTYRNARTPKRR